jgi:vancomycin resistance protein YoaR
MFVVAAGFGVGYYVVTTRGEARAATVKTPPTSTTPHASEPTGSSTPSPTLAAYSKQTVAVATGGGDATLSWADLGVELDPDEIAHAGTVDGPPALAALAKNGAIPVRVDRERAAKALAALKAKYDTAPINAFLDLEERAIHADTAGKGIDVWASLPRIEAAARQGAAKIELAIVGIPARVTKETLGIADISHVLGHYTTRFPVTDQDRNFNLKLAASKINGAVIAPGAEWSFNGWVGERSEKEGYKIAHVITAGEMVDGLAGGTCQISTTLFGASFFAGLQIVKTTNHSRPSVYTPLGFDATVVWPKTDLVLKNPYEFPVAIHYRVANGEALVEVLGKDRPWDKIVFARKVTTIDKDDAGNPTFPREEHLDDKMPESQPTFIDQQGFPGIKLVRLRRFMRDNKVVKEERWAVEYKPVTEYTHRGTNTDPEAKPVYVRDVYGPKVPTSDEFAMSQ